MRMPATSAWGIVIRLGNKNCGVTLLACERFGERGGVNWNETHFQGMKSMLVLTRRIGESLEIDDRIQVKVLQCRGRVVRLGISAPDDVIVQRSEILARSIANSAVLKNGGFAHADEPIMDRLIRIAR